MRGQPESEVEITAPGAQMSTERRTERGGEFSSRPGWGKYLKFSDNPHKMVNGLKF